MKTIISIITTQFFLLPKQTFQLQIPSMVNGNKNKIQTEGTNSNLPQGKEALLPQEEVTLPKHENVKEDEKEDDIITPPEIAAKLVNGLRIKGKVVKGFGRGSKVLGFPTANLDIDRSVSFDDMPEGIEKEKREFVDELDSEGVYFGFAQVIKQNVDPSVYMTALSIGKNPTFDDVKQRVIEPWILNDYGMDFYDAEVRLIILKFFRRQAKFTGEDFMKQLIDAITNDGKKCEEFLSLDEFSKFKEDAFFKGEKGEKDRMCSGECIGGNGCQLS